MRLIMECKEAISCPRSSRSPSGSSSSVPVTGIHPSCPSLGVQTSIRDSKSIVMLLCPLKRLLLV